MEYIKKKKIIQFIILICFFLILFFSFFFFSKMNQKNVDEKKLQDVLLELENQNTDNLLIQKKQIDEKFINIVYELQSGTYKSYFVNSTNGKIMQIEDLIKPDKIKIFQNKVSELIEKKFPKFIQEGLKNDKVEIAYEIGDKELILHFSNYQITPSIKEELFLKINYNEIKDEINFKANLSEEYEVENGFHYDKNKKTIAFTFDDGPSGNKTQRLLNILKENKMHATFFMVGNRMESFTNIILETLQNGNEIGSHSFQHGNMTRLKKEELIEDERKTNEIYKKITGNDLKLLRPPYGNVNQLMKDNLNYSFVNWNIDTEDWRYRNAEHIYHEVISKVEDGDIILMHDLYDSTIEAVEKLLPELYVRGFQVVTVSELANLKGVTLEPKKVIRSIK